MPSAPAHHCLPLLLIHAYKAHVAEREERAGWGEREKESGRKREWEGEREREEERKGEREGRIA